jgi:ABC-type transport system involved in multi-copper enzyme maturation permease subunit
VLLNLFRAEWLKVVGNRWVTGCLIWIFPLAGAVFVFLFSPVVMIFSSSARASFAADTHLWTDQLLGAWGVPNNPLGRLLLLGFTAVVFAGEYQWSTWKNVIPRNRRIPLILTKFLTLGVLVLVAFMLLSLVLVLGVGLMSLIVGSPYPPKVTGSVLADLAGDYVSQAGLAFTSTMIAAGYAALAAMVTRSILGGIIVGFVVTFVENLSAAVLALVAFFLDWPGILQSYRVTPGYNLLNVGEWIANNKPLRLSLPYNDVDRVVLSDSLMFSAVILALWVIGLIALTTYFFHKQDITA